MDEIWKDIIGYEGKYQISNFGRVKSLLKYVNKHIGFINFERILTIQYYKKTKYAYIILMKNSKFKCFTIHRLVGFAFIENDDLINKKHINHKNGIRTDNRVENLEWVTQKDNNNYKFKLGYTVSKETGNKISKSKIGYKHSKESKNKISKSNKGKVPWNKGIPCSEETKNKISTSKRKD